MASTEIVIFGGVAAKVKTDVTKNKTPGILPNFIRSRLSVGELIPTAATVCNIAVGERWTRPPLIGLRGKIFVRPAIAGHTPQENGIRRGSRDAKQLSGGNVHYWRYRRLCVMDEATEIQSERESSQEVGTPLS